MSGILNRLLVLMLSLAAGVCFAQSGAFPVKPVRFVVGFTPGGPSDILARALGQKLGELFRAMTALRWCTCPTRARSPHSPM